MRTSVRRAAVLLVLTSALASSGCSPASPTPRPDPSPTATPLFATDEEALAAAEEAYRAYQAVSDLIFSEGGIGIDRLESVVTGEQLKVDSAGFRDIADLGYHSVGNTSFRDLELQSQTSDFGIANVVVYLCEDVSGVDVLDRNGVSIVPAERPDVVRYEVGFTGKEGQPKTLLVESREVWTAGQCQS
jgi:hypothetical protein